MADFQDWEEVKWDRRRPNGRVSGQSKREAMSKARQEGRVATERRFAGGENKSAHHQGGGRNMRKLDEETEELRHNRVDRSLAMAIQQARLARSMTQKALATAINEKPQVIGEYESGRAIPNGQILVKLDRALGTRLPRGNKKKKKKKKN
mmetsp:Transcript_276/g.504  ORF Transcript_276/g.504 Transcript_276/m.504 type:complete len:150 (-) Transcript_276:76-525(-)